MTILTEICRRNGLRLSALAEKIGVARDTVKKWGGERRIPASRVPAIIKALGGAVSPADLRPDIYPPEFTAPGDRPEPPQ